MAGPYPNDQGNPAAAIPVYVTAGPAGGGTGVSATNIPTNTSTLVKTGAGVFYGLSINTNGSGSTAKVYDGTSAAGTLLATINTGQLPGPTFPAAGVNFATGLFVATTGDQPADITVYYK